MSFAESANYLGMTYLGDIHTYIKSDTINNEVKLRMDTFIKTISSTI
ncbi:hypothetical protein [Flavivirga sp. 57AJ16]|nr:hypothetical protein [Flavivirga sp. 57AJ16]MDD7884972.1 hypothetical protein [Flavivirga sp. 57AJ16]